MLKKVINIKRHFHGKNRDLEDRTQVVDIRFCGILIQRIHENQESTEAEEGRKGVGF